MKTKQQLSKRLVCIVLCAALILTCIPFTVFAAVGGSTEYYNRVVDISTMNKLAEVF